MEKVITIARLNDNVFLFANIVFSFLEFVIYIQLEPKTCNQH